MKKKAINKKMWVIVGSVVVLLAVLGVNGYMVSRGSNAGREENMLELGQRYLDELNYEQAIVCFEEYLEIDPQCVEAYLGLAEAYEGLQNYRKALEVLAEGYAVTGDSRLQEQSWQIEEQYAETLASGNAMAGDGADNTGEVYEGEKDSRFEACVVDGIYHHGYRYYNLTLEEEEYLQSIVDQAHQENIDEVFSLLGGEELIALLRNHDGEFREWEDGYIGLIYIAFHQYKIYCSVSGGTSGLRELTLIPLDEGTGYYFNSSLGLFEFQEWAISTCRNGMFDGEFVLYQRGDSYLMDTTGNLKNGLLDGAVMYHQNFPDTNYENWRRTDFVMGKVQVFEETTDSDGTIHFYYGYMTYENGEPILNYDGSYVSKEGTVNEDMLQKYQSVDVGTLYSGTAVDGGMCYYPW